MSQIVGDLKCSGIELLCVQTLGSSHPSPEYIETRAFYEAMGFLPLLEFRQEGWKGPTLIMVRRL